MKIILLLLPVFLLGICSYAQTADTAVVTNSRPHVFGSPSTTTSLNVSHSSGWWQIVGRENVSFKTSKFQLSSIENKIMDFGISRMRRVEKPRHHDADKNLGEGLHARWKTK